MKGEGKLAAGVWMAALRLGWEQFSSLLNTTIVYCVVEALERHVMRTM